MSWRGISTWWCRTLRIRCTDAEPLERRMCAIKKMGELDAPNATIQRLLGR
jgi:hypothetical protein